MKTSLLILLLFVCLNSFTQGFGDNPFKDTVTNAKKELNDQTHNEKTVPELIEKSGSNISWGVIMLTGGSVMSAIGAASSLVNFENKTYNVSPLVYIGPALNVIGTIVLIDAGSKLNKAGERMQAKQTTLKIKGTRNGTGIVLNF